MNKQAKIIENKIAQQSKEITELQNTCSSRLEVLARSDGVYQNLQGQVMEKQKRLIDMNEFLQMISKELKTDESGKSSRQP